MNPVGQEASADNRPAQLSLIDLEQFTKNALNRLQQLTEELRAKKQMLQDGYINNPVYREQEAKVKEARKALLAIKSQISKNPDMANMARTVKDLNYDLKATKQSASSYAIEFSDLSGADTLEKDGQLFKIVKTAKLIATSKKM